MREHITIMDSYGDDIDLPARRILCPSCNGDGEVCHPAFTEQAITAEEWETEWDDDEREAYLGGRYDVECPECEGRRWVLVLDEGSCTPEEIREYRSHCDSIYAMDRESAAERRFGC